MKNRVARYPGRIKLTEVPGKPGYYVRRKGVCYYA